MYQFNKVHYDKKADELRANFNMKRDQLTNIVMKEITDEFMRRFPKRSMMLLFGMGGHFMEIDGKAIDIDDIIPYHSGGHTFEGKRELQPLLFFSEALAFLDELHDDTGIDCADVYILEGSISNREFYLMGTKPTKYVGLVTTAKTNIKNA